MIKMRLEKIAENDIGKPKHQIQKLKTQIRRKATFFNNILMLNKL